jgi:uncharacterized membrane protein
VVWSQVVIAVLALLTVALFVVAALAERPAGARGERAAWPDVAAFGAIGMLIATFVVTYWFTPAGPVAWPSLLLPPLVVGALVALAGLAVVQVARRRRAHPRGRAGAA